MNLRLPLLALMAALSPVIQAQELPPSWNPGTWPVTLGDEALANPWVGGLTAPQWSAFDADLDGDDDLFAFDRDGSRVLMFERMESDALVMRWDWTEGWPDMVDWCLLRDYNCDGKPDIFTSHQNGIRVFTNTTEAGEGPSFDSEPITLFATFDLIGSDPSDLPVICLGMDLPAIGDHDDDGDLDIITSQKPHPRCTDLKAKPLVDSTSNAPTAAMACSPKLRKTMRCSSGTTSWTWSFAHSTWRIQAWSLQTWHAPGCMPAAP